MNYSNDMKKIYMNHGARYDAIRFDLAGEERGKRRESRFRSRMWKLATAMIYLSLLVPFFIIYFVIASLHDVIVNLFKRIPNVAGRVKFDIEKEPGESENSLAYNP